MLDRFSGQDHASLRAAELAADRVGRVDLFARVVLAVRAADVDHQVSRDREHRRLALFGIQPHEQDRVAVRGIAAIVGALGLRPAVGAEHQERLRAAAVDGGHQALGHDDRVAEDLFGDARGRVQRNCERGGEAERHDEHAADEKALPHRPPQLGRALLIHGRSSGVRSSRGRADARGLGEGSAHRCGERPPRTPREGMAVRPG